MKRVLIVAAAMTVASVCSAQAADLAARPYTKAPPMMMAASVYDWSGFYVGLNGGYGSSSHNCWEVNDPHPAGCHDVTGGTFGGQIGYRWQMASWVFGLEGQGNWADFSGSNVNTWAAAFTDRTKIQSFGLITGQVGYTFNNVLLYAKGGAAVVDNKYDLIDSSNSVVASTGETLWNPTVGGGVEVGFAPNWSIGAEYNHIFQSGTTHGKLSQCTVKNTCGNMTGGLLVHKDDVDMALVRLNYKFGGPIMAKY